MEIGSKKRVMCKDTVLFQSVPHTHQWRTEGGGLGGSTPLRNSEDTAKLYQTQLDCENC